jgi:hypothetical protein
MPNISIFARLLLALHIAVPRSAGWVLLDVYQD